MEKRVSARAIIIEGNEVLTMFRRKKKDDGSYIMLFQVVELKKKQL